MLWGGGAPGCRCLAAERQHHLDREVAGRGLRGQSNGDEAVQDCTCSLGLSREEGQPERASRERRKAESAKWQEGTTQERGAGQERPFVGQAGELTAAAESSRRRLSPRSAGRSSRRSGPFDARGVHRITIRGD